MYILLWIFRIYISVDYVYSVRFCIFKFYIIAQNSAIHRIDFTPF